MLPTPFSKALLPLAEFELSLGNVINRVDENLWTACPLAIVFARLLHFAKAEARGLNREGVERWESRDPHYRFEAGYVDPATRHTLARPIPPSVTGDEIVENSPL